jgi:hypothetical protein
MKSTYNIFSSYCASDNAPKVNYGTFNRYLTEGFKISENVILPTLKMLDPKSPVIVTDTKSTSGFSPVGVF